MFQIIPKGEKLYFESTAQDLYQYNVYVGSQVVPMDRRNSYWTVDNTQITSRTGDGSSIFSDKLTIELIGYTPEARVSTFSRGTDLPYVNGCSTKQLIPAARPGDPTFQMLLIPAGCKEQEHHIHATARIVYVLKGSGRSIVGMGRNQKVYALEEGQTLILGKMIPHHFETDGEDLVVLPMHIFSSGREEHDHPMFNGTHRV